MADSMWSRIVLLQVLAAVCGVEYEYFEGEAKNKTDVMDGLS